MADSLVGPTKIIYPGMWGYGAIQGYPLNADVSSPFGPRDPFVTPGGITGSFHTGIDLPAPKGTPIFSPCDFVVTFSGNPADHNDYAGQGMFGQLADGSGIGFWHMEGLQLDLGHVVRRGDIIGQVGTSGLSTGDHLHFMRLNGPIGHNISWYPIEQFRNPMGDFVDIVTSGPIVIEPAPVEEPLPEVLVSFISNSLLALANNPPQDMTAALIELNRRIEYLKTLLNV